MVFGVGGLKSHPDGVPQLDRTGCSSVTSVQFFSAGGIFAGGPSLSRWRQFEQLQTNATYGRVDG